MLGWCSQETLSRSGVDRAFKWVKSNRQAITDLLDATPVVDLDSCITTYGSPGHDVDFVVRFTAGFSGVANAASLVLALVAMAWRRPSPVGVSAVGFPILGQDELELDNIGSLGYVENEGSNQ